MCSQTSAGVPDFWIGVVCAASGDIVLNFGINLQRLAHIRIAQAMAVGAPVPKHYTLHPIWISGMVVYLVGNLGSAFGLAYTPQSVITPIGSVSIVSNLAFARFMIGERIGLPTLLGVALILAGVVTIVTAADATCTVETVDSLLAKWKQRTFLTFAGVQLSILSCWQVYVILVEQRMRKESEGTPRCLSEVQKKTLRLAYTVLASMYATWTVLLVKSIGELVKETFRGANQLLRWETYMLLIGGLTSAPAQVRYLNAGLRHFESLFVIPVFYAFWVFGSILMGGFYFGEFSRFTAAKYGAFAAGVIINVSGVAVISTRAIDTRDDERGPSVTPVALETGPVPGPTISTTAGLPSIKHSPAVVRYVDKH